MPNQRRHRGASRRDLLLGGLGLAGVGGFAGMPLVRHLAHAGAAGLADRYFVFCYFSGGWDILLGLDPRDPGVFRPDLIQDTLIDPGYATLDVDGYPDPDLVDTPVAGMTLGPFARPLVPLANQLAIVRGMSMETLTHEVGRRRFITGKPPSGLLARGSSIATTLAANLGSEAPIPNLSARVESYNADQPSWSSALKVDDVDDLVRALAPGSSSSSQGERERLDALMAQTGDCRINQRSVMRTDALDLRAGAHDLVSQELDSLFAFGDNTPQMQALRDHYGIGNDLSSSGAQAAMAVTALTAGISRCVSIQAASGLDTHYDNWQDQQGPLQESGFEVVAALASDLASRPYGSSGESWLDRTVIVGFSEFSRTALLNSTGGRDHSLTNACFLLGGGVRGGQVIGASSDVGMGPRAVDLATGELVPGGEIVRPEHVHRALLSHIGVTEDVADLRVEPLSVLFTG
ncbi:MAG: DUF1501 domain-containing protein [Myxococcales bacterium]|nr:DUF1501 domain-containing protein [Myxococcales bacterium]